MSQQHRALIRLLRVIGTLDLTAAAVVICPRTWIANTHQWLGLGEFPQSPIAGYLARNLSLWFAIYGLLLWYVSFNVQRYSDLIHLLARVLVLQGFIITGIDLAEGLPTWWAISEGPVCSSLGMALIFALKGEQGASSP